MSTFFESSLPLFLQTESPTTISEDLSLTIHGSSGSGEFAGFPLFTFSDESGNLQTRNIPIFLAGSNQDSWTASMNLWTGGVPHSASAGVELFLHNSMSGVVDGVDLFIGGSGINDGYFPFNSSMNLWLQRNPAEMISLYLQGPGQPSGGSIDLFLSGKEPTEASLTLAMPAIGKSVSPIKFYTHGF